MHSTEAGPEKPNAQARLDALIDWLAVQVDWHLPIGLAKEASEALHVTEDSALKSVLRDLLPFMRVTSPLFVYDWRTDLRKYVSIIEHLLDEALAEELAYHEEWRAKARSAVCRDRKRWHMRSGSFLLSFLESLDILCSSPVTRS